MKIYSAINAIMKEIGGIEKNRKNEKQGYRFRGIDDVYLAAQPLFSKYGVFTLPRVTASQSEIKETKNGSMLYRILTVEYDFISSEDGSKITACVIGEGMDPGDKATNKAMSAAHKYALLQVFAIPTEEPKDSEIDSPQLTNAPGRSTIDRMLSAFMTVGMTPHEIEDLMKKPIDDFTNKDIEFLRNVLASKKSQVKQ